MDKVIVHSAQVAALFLAPHTLVNELALAVCPKPEAIVG